MGNRGAAPSVRESAQLGITAHQMKSPRRGGVQE